MRSGRFRPDKRQEVLDHVTPIRDQATQPRKPRKSGRGLWAGLGVDLTANEIDRARDEMWKGFPRDDV